MELSCLGCASRIYGEFNRADLIKIHISSRKVSLMHYDFEGRAVPLLMERAKVFLGKADYALYVYGDEHEIRPLYLKSRYLPDGFPRREDQMLFDEKLSCVIELGDERHSPSTNELKAALDAHGLEVRGFRHRGFSASQFVTTTNILPDN